MTAASATQTTPGKITRPTNAEDALAVHGFDGDKVLAYARTIARREMNRAGSTLGDRHDDLVMFLTETGCRTAVKYDPRKSSATYTFSSYIYDVMARRVPDFYRRKGEGFGDKRRGQDNRVQLVETVDIDSEASALEKLVSTDQVDRYRATAQLAGMGLGEWMLTTLDLACEAA